MKAWTIGLALICAVLPFTAVRNHAEVHDDVFLRGPGSLVADARADMAMLWQADLFASYGEETGPSGMWRPLVLLGFRAEHFITNGSPGAFAWLGHVVNVLFHTLATLALLFVLVRIGLPEASALLAAALFGLHPVHAESVAWLSGRSDLGATALIWCGTALLLSASSPSWTRLASAFALMLGGLLFKETGVLLVALVPVLGLLAGRPRRLVLTIPLLALGAWLLLRAWLFTRTVSTDGYMGPDDPAVRWFTWASILSDVVRLGIWPGPATPLRPVLEAHGPGAPGVISGAVLLLVVLALAGWTWVRRLPVPTFALLLLGGTLLMLAPWVRYPTGFPEVAAPLYERYAYASAAAVPLLIGWLLRGWLPAHPARAGVLVLVAIACLTPVTRSRAAVWASDESFARAGLVSAPRSVNMWNHLGVALLERYRTEQDASVGEEALAAIDRAVSLEPGHKLASLNQFIAFAMLDRDEEAFVAAARLVDHHATDPAILDNVANWHASEGRWQDAANLFALEIETGHPMPGAAEALAECLRLLELEQAGSSPPGGEGGR
ncbi:MAG: tetratricopeptide repeat protein [Planctomycetota bacterium]